MAADELVTVAESNVLTAIVFRELWHSLLPFSFLSFDFHVRQHVCNWRLLARPPPAIKRLLFFPSLLSSHQRKASAREYAGRRRGTCLFWPPPPLASF
jgi:hypothetical protein